MVPKDTHFQCASTEETIEMVRAARVAGAEVVFLVGPTASGKSALGIALATALRGEIVCADSQQVYRGMEIGTAKPTGEERAALPHHLFDLVDPSEQFTVAQYLDLARPCIASLVAAQKLPIIVGGSGLYVHALALGYRLAEGGEDAELRATLQRQPLETLVRDLESAAPAIAARIDRKNPRRVIRALERVRSGGGGEPSVSPPPWKPYILGISMEPSVLRLRIQARVDGMFQRGFLEEVRTLLDRYGADAPGLRALGYTECVAVLQGAAPRAGLEERIAVHTAQYAKRQRTWFRKTPGLVWIRERPGAAH